MKTIIKRGNTVISNSSSNSYSNGALLFINSNVITTQQSYISLDKFSRIIGFLNAEEIITYDIANNVLSESNYIQSITKNDIGDFSIVLNEEVLDSLLIAADLDFKASDNYKCKADLFFDGKKTINLVINDISNNKRDIDFSLKFFEVFKKKKPVFLREKPVISFFEGDTELYSLIKVDKNGAATEISGSIFNSIIKLEEGHYRFILNEDITEDFVITAEADNLTETYKIFSNILTYKNNRRTSKRNTIEVILKDSSLYKRTVSFSLKIFKKRVNDVYVRPKPVIIKYSADTELLSFITFDYANQAVSEIADTAIFDSFRKIERGYYRFSFNEDITEDFIVVADNDFNSKRFSFIDIETKKNNSGELKKTDIYIKTLNYYSSSIDSDFSLKVFKKRVNDVYVRPKPLINKYSDAINIYSIITFDYANQAVSEIADTAIFDSFKKIEKGHYRFSFNEDITEDFIVVADNDFNSKHLAFVDIETKKNNSGELKKTDIYIKTLNYYSDLTDSDFSLKVFKK